jgi:hypothetical protein
LLHHGSHDHDNQSSFKTVMTGSLASRGSSDDRYWGYSSTE